MCLFKVHVFFCYAGVYFGSRLRSLSIDWLLITWGVQNVPFSRQSTCVMYVMLFYHGPTLQAEANGSHYSLSPLCLRHQTRVRPCTCSSTWSVQQRPSSIVVLSKTEKRSSPWLGIGPFSKVSEKAWFLLAKKTKMAYWLMCSIKSVCVLVRSYPNNCWDKTLSVFDSIVKWVFKEADCFWSQGSQSDHSLHLKSSGMGNYTGCTQDTGCRQNDMWSWIQDADRMMYEAGYRMQTKWCVKLDLGCRQNDVWSWIQDADRMMYEAGFRMQTKWCMKLETGCRQDADRMVYEAGFGMQTEWCVKLDTGCRQDTGCSQNDVWSWMQDADRMMYEAESVCWPQPPSFLLQVIYTSVWQPDNSVCNQVLHLLPSLTWSFYQIQNGHGTASVLFEAVLIKTNKKHVGK